MLFLQSYLFGVFITLASWYVIYTWKRRRLYYLASKIPGPTGLPFVGKAFSVLGGDHKKAFRNLTSLTRDYETPTKVWYGPYCAILLDKAEDLRVVLNSDKCLDKSEVYKYVGLNKGLVVADGDIWKSHRKLLDPSFNVNLLQSFIPIFNQKSKILIKQLEKRVHQPEADIFMQIAGCTLETLLMTMMGVDKDIQSDVEHNKYLQDFEIGSKLMNDQLFKIWLHWWPIFRFSSFYPLHEKYLINGMFAMANDILNCIKTEKKSLDSSTKSKIFIDQLLSAKDKLKDDEIIDEINTFIAAGHETSSLILSAALLMLAMHKDVQKKAFDEVQKIVQQDNGDITERDLYNMQYVEMVIKETMRLFPVLPLHGRLATDDIELEKCTIPRGANIVISVFNAHRNPKNWGDTADRFIPERFLPENFSKLHPYAFIPFSKGPRTCIGWRYSYMFMKTVLFHILKYYKISTNLKYEDLEYEIALTMKIVQKYKVTLESREIS